NSHLSLLHTTPPTPISTLFPYTTLFRSHSTCRRRHLSRASCGLQSHAGMARRPVRLDRSLPGGLSAKKGPRKGRVPGGRRTPSRSEEHTSELQSRGHLVCRLLLEKKKR